MDIDAWRLASVIAQFATYGFGLLSAGIMLNFFVFGPSLVGVENRLRRMVILTAFLAALSLLARIAIEAGYLLDDGLWGMLDAEMLSLVASSPVGNAAAVGLLGLSGLVLASMLRSVRAVLGTAAALVFCVSFPLSGHATAEPQALFTALIALHVALVTFWIGIIAPLLMLTRESPVDTARVGRKFGTIAAVTVPMLMVAAGLFTILRVPDPLSTLPASAYGQVLAIKIFAVAVLLVMAAANKLRWVPGLERGDAGAMAGLRRSLRLEAVLFACILAATAILTTVTPIPGMNGH